MAFVQNKGCIRTLEHEAFNAIHKPGTKVPYSGIYQCQGCDNEIASNANGSDRFPPENHHQHTPEQGAIRWKLIVATK
ncbi:MAG: hypothetical protein BGO89_06895 [Candidatus Kapaibacterium thiocyanatum]|uniref:Protein L n=1 Tax=Candidatus Kapaibacterium thiocyanatum TaxID=1895771 RepID=A0A1M3KYX7_9BACT|nr:MAG: hypothetical protein BGO89_06895 ['Candidatus Kapabacteria' thiocyanatum]